METAAAVVISNDANLIRPGNDAILRVTVTRKIAKAQQVAEVAAAANAAAKVIAAARGPETEKTIRSKKIVSTPTFAAIESCEIL